MGGLSPRIPGRRSVAQPGRALRSGRRGRRFDSSHSDQGFIAYRGKIMRKYLSLFFLVSLAACQYGSVEELKANHRDDKFTISLDVNYQQAYRNISEHFKNCYRVANYGTETRVETHLDTDTKLGTITTYRHNWLFGDNYDQQFEIRPQGSVTIVAVYSRALSYTHDRLVRNMTEWAKGDVSCSMF